MDLLEVALQTILAFFAILIYARILGKQQVGQLTFFEYVNGVTFGSIAAVLATDIGPQKTLIHTLGLTLFVFLTFIAGFASLKNRAVRKLISGEGTVVIHNGKILEENMLKMRYNMDELLMQLREKDIFDIGEVEYAVLEPNGNLSVTKKSQFKSVTRQDLGLPSEYEGLSVELVVDGNVIHQNLKQIGLNEQWLQGELEKRNVKDLNDVNLAVLSSKGEFYMDTGKDNLTTPIDITDSPSGPSSQ